MTDVTGSLKLFITTWSTSCCNSIISFSAYIKKRPVFKSSTFCTPLEFLGVSISVKTSMVMLDMLRSCHYFKIFNSVIKSIFIFMMNYFALKKFSSKMLFHNKPMNQGLYSSYSFRAIATTKNSSFSTRSIFKTKGVSCRLEPLEVFNTISFGVMFCFASIDNAYLVINSFCHRKLIAQPNWRLN